MTTNAVTTPIPALAAEDSPCCVEAPSAVEGDDGDNVCVTDVEVVEDVLLDKLVVVEVDVTCLLDQVTGLLPS
jgi:hypothetical protein